MMRVKTLAELENLPAMHKETVRQQLAEQAQRKTLDLGPVFRAAPALQALAEPSRKYHNEPIRVSGERYDSKLEWRCAQWLKVRWEQGEILWFTRQVPFALEGGVRYRADFLAALPTSPPEVWDAKGRDTQASKNKRKQVLARYGLMVRLWPEEPS